MHGGGEVRGEEVVGGIMWRELRGWMLGLVGGSGDS